MKAVIIEDELAAVQVLEKLIAEVAPDIEVIQVLQSVEDSVEWFGFHPMVDLIFMDIHLADGSSFSIFEHADIACPVIFTTAYDQYALRAFEVNSVDYLLKPIDKEHLERAIGKFRNVKKSKIIVEENTMLAERLFAVLSQTLSYKSSLLIPVKDKLIPLSVKSIAYVYTEKKIVRIVNFEAHEIYIEQTLEEIYSQLDPRSFYRANRQYIISRDAVKDISFWFNGRLAVNLSVKTPERVFISRLNSKDFRNWMVK